MSNRWIIKTRINQEQQEIFKIINPVIRCIIHNYYNHENIQKETNRFLSHVTRENHLYGFQTRIRNKLREKYLLVSIGKTIKNISYFKWKLPYEYLDYKN